MTDYKHFINSNYPTTILSNTKEVDGHIVPRQYEGFNFESYLNICFPNKNFFIGKEKLDLFNNFTNSLYPNLRNSTNRIDFLKSKGLLPVVSEVEIKNLKLYQNEIYFDRLNILDGSSYLTIPVIVLQFGNDIVILDGYHRTFISISRGIKSIPCFLI